MKKSRYKKIQANNIKFKIWFLARGQFCFELLKIFNIFSIVFILDSISHIVNDINTLLIITISIC